MKKLIVNNEKLMKEWDYKRNENLNPKLLFENCSKKAWWICPRGHSYYSQISVRSKGSGCPFCNKGVLLEGFNDLQTKNPLLAAEWHPTKNGDLKPNNITANNGKKVWWLGKCGHEWEAIVSGRNKGRQCPYCTNEKLLPGFNDFASKYPDLLLEWDYNKNSILPNEIFAGTHKKIWWKCPFGHSYQSYPYNKVGKLHTGCPICDKENHTSFPEQAIYYYLKKYYPDVENSNSTSIGMELDIYIPSLKIAIEYDGGRWHKNNISIEIKKNKLCNENGITLIRIRETDLEEFDNCIIFKRKDNKTDASLSEVIKLLFKFLKINADIDVARDSIFIYNQYIINRKNKSIASKFPDLVSEWHPEKNGEIKPSMINYGSNKKIWWLGKCGHEWLMAVSDRTLEKCGCPICNGKRIISGINDLQTKFPEICLEWNYERNSKLDIFPNTVAPHSDKKVWWTCKNCGFNWKTKIDGRTRMKTGCPKCGRKKADLARSKAVKCIETGLIYNSLKDAENKTGINRMCIGNCCKGKQKTAGRYHWKYIERL